MTGEARIGRLALACLLCACGGKEASDTGVTLTIAVLDDTLSIDAFRLRAEIEGRAAKEERIDLGRAAGSSESINLWFADEDGGREVRLIVAAYLAGNQVATGYTTFTLVEGRFITANVRLPSCGPGDAPFCDGDISVDCNRVPREETCAFGCNPAAGACHDCLPGTNACDFDTFVSCDATGVRVIEEDCSLLAGACRAGTCTPSGCVSTPANDGAGCDDGLFCTEATTCADGACAGGVSRICDDGDACTSDSCDEASDTCDVGPVPDGTPCQGADYCSISFACQAGACTGATPRPCDDGNPCTADSCDETGDQCRHQNLADNTQCEDGEFCSLADRCQAGTCTGGALSPCTDANPCTIDGCDETADACSPSPAPPGSFCADAATAVTCDGAGNPQSSICAFGCNLDRDECNECDPDPARLVTCRADVEALCNAEHVCSPEGLIVAKQCCNSNQCTCDGSSCVEELCAAATDVTAGGSFAGDTCGAADNVPGDCNPGGQACLSVASGGAPEEMYRLSLDDGSPMSRFYEVVLDTSASPAGTELRVSTVCGNEALQLATAEVCAPTPSREPARACGSGQPGGETLVLCGLPEGSYFAAVDSEAGTCGSYDLDVTVTQVDLDTASAAGNISRGGVFVGNTCGLGDHLSYPNTLTSSCGDLADCIGGVCPACSASAATDCRVTSAESLCAHSGSGSADAVFYLALNVDSGVDISTSGSSFDTVLYLLKAGTNGLSPPGSVRVCNDDCYEANGASHIQTSLEAGLYYVVLDGAGGACGNFRLSVTVSPSATCPNLTCESAFETCESCPNDCRCQNCGDGVVDDADGERCDDDGQTGGDGCSARCIVEPGYKCRGAPSLCTPHCGEGEVDAGLGEECDDNNNAAGDGCGATCLIEPGFSCTGAPSFCSAGGTFQSCPALVIPEDSTFITDTITVPSAFTIADVNVDINLTHTYVSDLLVELESPASTSVTLHNHSGLSSDDVITNFDLLRAPDGPGAMDDFDGESAAGTWTLRLLDNYAADVGTLHCWTLNLAAPTTCGNGDCEPPQELCDTCPADCPCTSCGDGVQEPAEGEECDDGDGDSADGCSSDCRLEPEFECAGSRPTVCVRACGDGEIDADRGEACDDGGTAALDGCGPTCQVEPGYGCIGAPSTCALLCSNGVLDPGEGCDDGGSATGDGCDGACAVESGYVCDGAPSTCRQGQRVRVCPGTIIPDMTPAGITSTINITRSCVLADVNVDVAITHAWVGDLIVQLRSPANTTLDLHNRSGGSANNIAGNYDLTLVPDGAAGMNVFNGQAANGSWRLSVSDRESPDQGTLDCWAVAVYCQ